MIRYGYYEAYINCYLDNGIYEIRYTLMRLQISKKYPKLKNKVKETKEASNMDDKIKMVQDLVEEAE